MVSIASAAARPAAPAMSKQPKAAKKIIKTQKPTLVRKRNEADMDGDTPSSPSKKAKVTFSPAVEINIISDSEKSPELIREEVRWAVTRHARGDDVEYDKLKNIFSRDFIEADIPSPTTIKNTLAALVGVASDLDRSCSALVQMMLNSDWIRRTDDYVTLFRRFLGHLASSKPTWLAPTLRMLVENFLTCNPHTVTPAFSSSDIVKVQSLH